jgi:hypothetical protein
VSLANTCRKRKRKITVHPRPGDYAALQETRRWRELMVDLLEQSLAEGDVHGPM